MKILKRNFHKVRLWQDRFRHKTLASALSVLLAIFFSLAVSAQNNITVKGRVTTETGQPVPRVSVSVKGNTTGTTGDENGNFSITVPDNAVLVFSAVDFNGMELRVNGRTSLDVTMIASEKILEQVVVVGYGTQRRKDVTGAVTSVSEKALREVPVANLQQALQGRAAGVEIQRTSTQPGGSSQIRIRGIRSITGSNDPLFVVDGIPWEGSLNDINPDDVASIDILKDASATAIYGSRGANGVIIVTTKRGRGGDTRVSYNGYYGIGKAANEFPVFSAEEYKAYREIRQNPTYPFTTEELKGIAQGRNTNWQDLMYENSMRTDHNISVTGGSNGNNFSLGGGYFKETALLPGEDFTRYTVRASIDSRIGKRIKVGVITQNMLSITNGSQFVSGSSMYRNLALSPLMPAYDSAGNIYLTPWGNSDDNNAGDRYNPLLLKNNDNDWVDRVRRLRTFNTLYGEIEFIKGLRYRFNLGLNYAQQHNAQFRGADNYPTNPGFFRFNVGNLASVENGETWGYTAENLLYYDRTIADKHKIGFTGLYSIQENQSFSNFVQKDSITEDFVQWYNLAQSTPTNGANTVLRGAESRWALISYMARVNYSFMDRYLLTLTYRRDGSSRLAEGNKWFNYPAVSAGWVISDESFMQNVKSVSSLKLRAGWGKTSNQAINPYDALGSVSNASDGGLSIRYNFGPTIVSGYNVVTLPNPALSWEFTTVTNIGLDFGFLKNRITGSLEYYNAKTNDILYSVSLPVTSGVAGAFQTNIGEMENKGFEFSLSADIIRSKSGFIWNADLNLFRNKNKILKLSNNVTQDIANQLFVGYPMSAIYDYNKIGIWQTNEAAQAATFGSVPGQLKLEDHSGPTGKPDGVINNNYDRFVIGDGDADLQGGMTHRFSYKGFDLSAVFFARFGGTLISNIHQPFAGYLTVWDGRRNSLKTDYWTPTNPTNWFPMPTGAISPLSDTWSTLGYYDASFIKLRSVNLGYTFNRSVLRHINAQSARLYFSIDNVAILSSPYYKQTGIDPEGTGSGFQGVSNPGNIRNNNRGNGTVTIGLTTPLRRTFTFGMNITL